MTTERRTCVSTSLAVFLWLTLGFGSALRAGEDATREQAVLERPLKLMDIAEQLRAVRKTIASIDFEYVEILEDAYRSGGVNTYTNGATYHIRFAAKGKNVFHRFSNIADEHGPTTPLVTLKIATEEYRLEIQPDSRIVLVTPDPYQPSFHQVTHYERQPRYLEAIGLWISTGLDPDQENYFLPDALLAAEARLLDRQEMVDGTPCVVVERAGRDKIWLDQRLGFTIRRRLWHGKDRTGRKSLYDYRMRNFHEVGPGIWLPWAITTLVYDDNPAAPDKPICRVVDDICMADLRINQVPDSVFSPTFDSGTVFTFRDTNRQSSIPGGEELLDELVRKGVERFNCQVGLSADNGGTMYITVALILNLVLLMMIIIMSVNTWPRFSTRPRARILAKTA